MIRTLDGEEGTLASIGYGRGPRVGRYLIHVEEFERLVLSRINPEYSAAELYVIDEIGKMELMSKRFREGVITLLSSRSNLLATVAKRFDLDAKRVMTPSRNLLDISSIFPISSIT